MEGSLESFGLAADGGGLGGVDGFRGVRGFDAQAGEQVAAEGFVAGGIG